MQQFGRPARIAVMTAVTAISACLGVVLMPGAAVAGPGDPVITSEAAPANANLPPWLRKMAGSSAELGTYIGSGSFYTNGYSNPYVLGSLYLRPTYDLGTRFKLALTARFYIEEEFTLPDVPNGRRWTPYDTWLTLGAKNLHTFDSSKVVVGGILRLIVPTSYESFYSHLVAGISAGPTLTRKFEFGSDPAPERRFTLVLTFIELFTKYLRTSEVRGQNGTSGCRGVGSGAVSGGMDGPDPDRCGGPINTSFGLRTVAMAALSRGKWDLSAMLLVDNAFKYRIPLDGFSDPNAVDRGRVDSTWGVLSVTYALTDHFGVNVGLSSFQNALDQRNRLRFPFFDFSGGANANNFTQVFVSLSGTL